MTLERRAIDDLNHRHLLLNHVVYDSCISCCHASVIMILVAIALHSSVFVGISANSVCSVISGYMTLGCL